MFETAFSLLVAVIILSLVWKLILSIDANVGNAAFDMLNPMTKARVTVASSTAPQQSNQEETQHGSQRNEVADPVEEESVAAAAEIIPSPLIVRHLDQGRATLLIRYRTRKNACTGHLIVWSGAKRKRIQDSYYDLGIIAQDKVDDLVIEEFLRSAMQRLNELRAEGLKKRTRIKKAAATDVIETEFLESKEAVVAEAVVAEAPQENVKLKAFPSVYRGVITEIGMLTKEGGESPVSVFGVRYRTLDGSEQSVFGGDLRSALRDVKAGVGDEVEILKLGRKTVEQGRAPMNLFQVTKLPRQIRIA